MMASFLRNFLIPTVTILPFLATYSQADTGVDLGSTLYALYDDNSMWISPSGDFAFGFRPFPGQEDRFLLAIWFAKIPDRTIVWSAKNYPVPVNSKLELTPAGELALQGPEGWLIWGTENNNKAEASHGALLDTGNFVITGKDSSAIWQSFKEPTNTILPTQVLEAGEELSSTLLENNFAKGRFELQLLQEGGLVLNQIDTVTGYTYGTYFRIENVSQLIFNESGYLYTNESNKGMVQLIFQRSPGTENFYHRATLDFDGTFTQYIHPKNGNESWSVVSVMPSNICMVVLDVLGSGPCGYNSYCESDSYGKPQCGCPPGFSLLDSSNRFSGCKQDAASYLQDCDQEGSSVAEDRFDFLKVDGVDWPLADYQQLRPSSEYECMQSCLHDCYCSVAIFQDPTSNYGTGSCWKKKLPLSNGRLNRSAVHRRALFKVLKANASSQAPFNRDSGKDNQNQSVLMLSILLGTSAFFNFFSVAALSLAIYFFCQRKMYEICRTSYDDRNFETCLHHFTYKDLEKATDNFKEQLGRGAFGIVYKGLLPSRSRNFVAVKKLNTLVCDGEKEFSSEVTTISQTHHKNLARLLGYCNEGEHRLLVYEFMPNGSLSSFLFGTLRLSWQQRVQIASGIARGLMYLHEECSKQIIHCDIKPQNILLDDTFTAKISDFGLAKLLINNQSRTLTVIRGTKGYVAPEWFRNTPVTAKVDIYSFGVMLLEIICCRRCVDSDMEKEAILTEWAYGCYNKGEVEKLVEADEEARSDLKRLERFITVAIWCVQDEPLLRPSTRTITLMLEGILEVPVPPCPFTYGSKSSSDFCSSNN